MYRKMVSILLILISLCGCTFGSKPDTTFNENTVRTIRVIYWDNETFMQKYGNLFAAKYPNINIEVLPLQGIYKPGADNNKIYDDFVQSQHPDILLLNADQYEKYASGGQLKELDPLIKSDQYDLNNYYSGVLTFLKRNNQGKLYGLAPFFNCNAIYYNKDLFSGKGIPFPKDQMSWDDLISLSNQFVVNKNKDAAIFGLQSNLVTNPFVFATTIGGSYGLRYIDLENKKMLMNTGKWTEIFKLVVNALKSGSIYDPSNNSKNDNHEQTQNDIVRQQYPFLNGNIAMSIQGANFIEILNQQKQANQSVFDWDIVTIPVDISNPNSGDSMSVSEVFAISSESENVSVSWSLIKYINSDEYAKIVSKSSFTALPSREKFAKIDGIHLDKFYKLIPPENSLYEGFNKLPISFLRTFDNLVKKEIDDTLNGEIKVEEALKHIQDQAQVELNSIP